MTRQKTISSLSIAAIALLAMAVPSFAQAQSEPDAQSSVATQAGDQTIVSSTRLIAVANVRGATPANARVEETRVAANPLSLSASAFKVEKQFTSATNKPFISPQPIFGIASDPTARKQFRADADESPSGRTAVTFVPSRGQKLPD